MVDYVNRQREQYDGEAVLVAAGTYTATETGTGIRVAENNELEVKLQVRGTVSGTGQTLDVTIEEDVDMAFGSPTVIATFPQVNSVTELTQMMRTTKGYIRAVATIAGTTPSFGDTEIFLVN